MPLVRLLGQRLLPAAGKAALPSAEALAGASTVGLYFSASWCPPCRGFTPQLKDAYSTHLHAKGLRCVLVSSDRDEGSFDDYFGSMPWLALPYAERARKEALSMHFGVQTIPTLVLLDTAGKILTSDGRNAVVADPEGKGFPWGEPTVLDLAAGQPGRVNSAPSVVLLCEGLGADGGLQKMLEGVAADAPEPPARTVGEGETFSFTPGQGYAFFLATGGPIAEKVRELAGLAPGGEPQLLLMDIPDNGGFYLGPAGEDALSAEAVRGFVADHVAGRLSRKQLA